jgi:hypothetical protein
MTSAPDEQHVPRKMLIKKNFNPLKDLSMMGSIAYLEYRPVLTEAQPSVSEAP